MSYGEGKKQDPLTSWPSGWGRGKNLGWGTLSYSQRAITCRTYTLNRHWFAIYKKTWHLQKVYCASMLLNVFLTKEIYSGCTCTESPSHSVSHLPNVFLQRLWNLKTFLSNKRDFTQGGLCAPSNFSTFQPLWKAVQWILFFPSTWKYDTSACPFGRPLIPRWSCQMVLAEVRVPLNGS